MTYKVKYIILIQVEGDRHVLHEGVEVFLDHINVSQKLEARYPGSKFMTLFDAEDEKIFHRTQHLTVRTCAICGCPTHDVCEICDLYVNEFDML